MNRLLLLMLLSWLAACTPRQFATRTTDAPTLARHRTVAILPFEVTQDRLRMRDIHVINSDTSQGGLRRHRRQWSAQQLAESQALAYQLQTLLYAQLQQQPPKNGYTVQFQTVEETNRRLQQAGISYATLPERTMQELQRALGVDALLSGQADLYQPLPSGLALAARVLLQDPNAALLGAPSPIPPSQAKANLTIHDCQTGQLAWHFEYQGTGAASLKPSKLVSSLVRSSASEFPYQRR